MEIRGGVSGWDTQRANQEVWAEGMVLLCMWTILVHPLVFQKYVMNLNFAIKALKFKFDLIFYLLASIWIKRSCDKKK